MLDVVRNQELAHVLNDFFEVRFEREVSCRKQLDGGIWDIAPKGFSARRNEVRVKFSPDSEQWRPCAAEVLLERGIELHVVGVVQKQVKLDVNVAGTRKQRRVERVAFGPDQLGIRDADGVLVTDTFGIETGAYGVAVLLRGLTPVALDGLPLSRRSRRLSCNSCPIRS